MTPYLEYEVPLGSETICVRIKDETTEDDNEVMAKGLPSRGGRVPEGILLPGRTYSWMVHIVNRPGVLPWIESLSDAKSFST